MSAPQTFRSAFNGFNREDVVRYIEFINAKHTTEVNQLKSEIDSLQTQLSAAAEAPDFTEELEALRRERDQLLEKVGQLEEHITAPSQTEQELIERCAALEVELEAARAIKVQAVDVRQCRIEQELEAYRRAERTERIARERAEQVYHQANGALSDATVKVDTAATQITQLTDAVLSQLNQLQDAVSGSKQALQDAAAIMYTIRPNADAE